MHVLYHIIIAFQLLNALQYKPLHKGWSSEIVWLLDQVSNIPARLGTDWKQPRAVLRTDGQRCHLTAKVITYQWCRNWIYVCRIWTHSNSVEDWRKYNNVVLADLFTWCPEFCKGPVKDVLHYPELNIFRIDMFRDGVLWNWTNDWKSKILISPTYLLLAPRKISWHCDVITVTILRHRFV